MDNTVICNNHLCGKEYHENFKKCPFCGTDNPSYKEPEKGTVAAKSESEKNKDIMRSVLRIVICCVVALLVLFVFSFLTVLIGIEGILLKYLGVGVAITAGVALNGYLKKKFSAPKK